MGLRVRNAVVGVKLEGTAYTLNAPVAADCFYAFDASYQPSGELFKRQETRDHFGRFDGIPGIATGQISFKVTIVGSGTAGTAPHFQDALSACGMSETIVAATSVTYKPVSTFDGAGDNQGATYTVAIFEDGVRYAIKGAQGSVKFTCKAGEPLVAEFSFSGGYVAPIDVSVPTPAGVSTEVPPTFLSAGLSTIGTYTPVFESLEFDMARALSPVTDANDANGTKGFEITGHDPVGSFDPDMVLIATNDYFAQWRAGTTGTITTGTIGSAGNQIQMVATRCQYDAHSMDEAEGRRKLGSSFIITTSTSASEGDDFSLAFT